MSAGSRRPSWPVKRIVGVVLLALVVLGMFLDTKFLSPEAAAKLNPAAFSAESYAKAEFPKVTEAIKSKATDIAVLAPAVADDLAAAGEKYGNDLGSNAYAFPVKATGTLAESDGNFALLAVPGVPPDTKVRIPLGAAVSGTPIRDATGDIKFGDFTGQTDYQSVANQFKLRIQADVLSGFHPVAAKGKQVTVYGAWATGGPPKSFIIQPVSIEVAP